MFEEYLPLKHKNVLKPASAAGADDAYERKAAANLKLWKWVLWFFAHFTICCVNLRAFSCNLKLQRCLEFFEHLLHSFVFCRVSDEGNSLKVTEIASKPLKKELLDTMVSYVCVRVCIVCPLLAVSWQVANVSSQRYLGLTVHSSFCQDCFIVDNGEAGIWVWTGKKATPKERRESMANAMVSEKN